MVIVECQHLYLNGSGSTQNPDLYKSIRSTLAAPFLIPAFISLSVLFNMPLTDSLPQVVLLTVVLYVSWSILKPYVVKGPLDKIPGPPRLSAYSGESSLLCSDSAIWPEPMYKRMQQQTSMLPPWDYIIREVYRIGHLTGHRTCMSMR